MKRLWMVAVMIVGLGVGAALVSPQSALAAQCVSASNCVSQGVTNVGGTGTTQNFNQIVRTIVNVLLFLIGIVAVIMIIFGAFRYITSNGAPDQAKAARNTIMYAVVGLVLAIAAYAIVRFVIGRF